MRNNKYIKLNFRVDDDYLIVHTLASMGKDRFSSRKHQKNILVFQNYAWKKHKPCYNLLVGRFSAIEIAKGGLQKTLKRLPDFLKELKASKRYKKIYRQTEEYLKFCERQWNDNYFVSSEAIEELTGLRLNKKFDVYITHPSLRNGSYRGSNTIEWGHNEDWPNYATVYLWHEILHSYIGWSDKEHAIIELIADEKLRTMLNGGKYPPFVGHKHLKNIKQKVLLKWKKYLKSNKHNIRDFIKNPHDIFCNSINPTVPQEEKRFKVKKIRAAGY